MQGLSNFNLMFSHRKNDVVVKDNKEPPDEKSKRVFFLF